MEDRIEAGKAFGRIGIGFSAFLIATFVLQIVIKGIVTLLTHMGVTNLSDSWYLFVASLANYVVGGFVLFLILKRLPVTGKPVSKRGEKPLLISSFFVCVSALMIGNIMGLILMNVVSALEGKPMVNPVAEVMEGLGTGTIFAIMVIMAPVCEEFLFRKLLIDRVRIYGDKAAILMSAIIFGLSHGNFYQFFYAFGIGAVFAYVYIRTGRLRYTILFHMIINFLGSIAAMHVSNLGPLAVLYALFLYGSVIAGITLFFTFRKRLVLWTGEKEVRGRGSSKILFLNAGMIIFFLLSAISFVVTEFL